MRPAICLLLFCIGSLLGKPAGAELVRYEIVSRTPYANGQAFGRTGPYEQIVGRVHFELDPAHPANRTIRDLQLAPRNAKGKVAFAADMFLLAPRDLARGNGALLYDVNNRGNKLALRFFNDAKGSNRADDPGNGFLMRQGWTIVWSGWDGELLPGNQRLQLQAPVARQSGKRQSGKRLTGPVRYEIVTDKAGETRRNVNGANHGGYRPTAEGLATARLTWRLRPGDRRVPIPRSQFQLHVTPPASSSAASQLPQVELELRAGFQPGYLYELIYTAEDPLVHGVTFASVRDLITSLKHGGGDGHPCLQEGRPVLKRAHGFGVSQSGRYLREFLYWGFNRDERSRKAFDGLMPHVAGGGLGSFNHRFAQPTAYVTQHQLHDWPTDRFPFAYETQRDPPSGKRDGILVRQTRLGDVPLVMHTQSSAEYWTRSGSLVHTDPLGKRDARPPKGVRIYAFGGTQHGPGSYPPSRGTGQNLGNPGDYRPLLRGLLTALDAWARDGAAPPPSVYPRIDQRTLVDWTAAGTGFPAIPGVRYPEVIQQPPRLDFGPQWDSQGLVTTQPPEIRGHYRVLASRCDRDGNPQGCLSPPEVMVPLATFTGWNLRARTAGAENELVSLRGSYLPFPRTAEEREKTGDPRPSIAERYGTLEKYIDRLTKACHQLVKQRYLLAEDTATIIARQRKRAEPLFSAKN